MKRCLLFGLVAGFAVLPLCGAGAEPPASAARKPVPVIFDTDITGDCDDVLALAMLHALADRGECRIEAVTISKINPLAAAFVDAVNTFYGRGDLPIGATRDAQRRESRYLEANFVNGIAAMQTFASDWPESVPVIWSDFRIGLAAPFPRESIARDFSYEPHHIVREAYLLHSGPNHDRPSWDLTSVLQDIRPLDGFFDLSPAGRVHVNDDGFTRFEPQPGDRDRHLILHSEQIPRVVATQRALASQPPSSRGPTRTP